LNRANFITIRPSIPNLGFRSGLKSEQVLNRVTICQDLKDLGQIMALTEIDKRTERSVRSSQIGTVTGGS